MQTLRCLLLALAAFITFVHAAPDDDPEMIASTFYAAILSGDADTFIDHIQIIPPEESEQLKKEMGEAGYQKYVDELTQELRTLISSRSAELQETLKENGVKISFSTDGITYTNANKTEAKVAITLKGEKKDGTKMEGGNRTVTLVKTPQGWKITQLTLQG